MSLVYTLGPRFIRPSEVIERLKFGRGVRAMTDADFQIFGAGDFEKSVESGSFVQGSDVAIYVMTGNGSSSLVTDTGLTINDVTHSIDILLYCQTKDNRSQYNDQLSVWFKEFLLWALTGYTAYTGADPLLPSGDSLQQIRNVADYSRVYQFYQEIRVDADDLLGDGDYEDLEDFELVVNDREAIAPDFDDVTPELTTTATLRP